MVPRYHVKTETSYVIVQASRRIHVVDSLSLARKICRKWNAELREGETQKRTATKGRDAKRADRHRGSEAQKGSH